MASRLGVSGTKHILLRCPYLPDLVAAGVLRLGKAPAKDLVDLDTMFIPEDRLHYLCGLHHWRSTLVYCNIHAIMQHD